MMIFFVLVLAILEISSSFRTPTLRARGPSMARSITRNVNKMSELGAVPIAVDDMNNYYNGLMYYHHGTLDLANIGSVDLTYAFMLPTAIAVSTLAISAGIGGAALFAPIILIIFPLLGPDYPLKSPLASTACAILVEVFGFFSGCIGYYRRNLIDTNIAIKFSCISVPAAILSARYLILDPAALKVLYSAIMIALSAYFFLGGTTDTEVSLAKEIIDCTIEPEESCVRRVDTTGNEYLYEKTTITAFGGIATMLGGGLTGLLGVGIGEVVLPQLLRRGVPVPVAAASSTLCVTATALSAAMIQVSSLIRSAEGGLDAIPWSLLQFMIPGVLIGGQIASKIQGKIPQESLDLTLSTLFGLIGVSFAVLTYFQTH